MALGDVSRLVHFGQVHAHEFLKRIGEVGVTAEALRPYSELCQKSPELLRRPIRRWHLRRAEAPRGIILRAFFFADPVPEAELRSALGNADLFDALVSAGLLVTDAEGVVCPLRLNLVDQLFFFADDLTEGGETVMGARATTVRTHPGGLAQ